MKPLAAEVSGEENERKMRWQEEQTAHGSVRGSWLWRRIGKARRHWVVLTTQLRASLLLTLQYRVEAIVGLSMSLFWTFTAVVPLLVLFQQRTQVAGWSWHEALLVVGWFNILKGLQAALIEPAMQQAVTQIRNGTLDFVLLKPADAQFLVSTGRFEPRQLTDSIVGFIILAYASFHLPQSPTLGALLGTVVAAAAGATVLYSLWIMVMSLAFVLVKIDNMTYLFSSVYDAARWPATVFRGAFAILFTFVLPLALMTTYPAEAMLHRLSMARLAGSVAAAISFFALARWVWQQSIRRYTSAGG